MGIVEGRACIDTLGRYFSDFMLGDFGDFSVI